MADNKKKENPSKARSHKEESIRQRAASLVTEDTAFTIVEAYKTARTNIIFSLGTTKGCKKIVVTSANPGEGKTTTTLNLAIVFAQTDAKVLVIDADLRKPRIYRHLQLERKGGLSDVLCDFIDVESAIHHVDKYGIDCITSGQIPPNPAELLSSDAMGELLDKLSERYDYIFIDTPPSTIVTEAAVLSRFVNGVIIVARQNYTIFESLAKARENLLFADAKILGYILNDISAKKYGYGRYYYRNYRSYGYGYGYNDGRYGYGYGHYGYQYGYGYGENRKSNSAENDNAQKAASSFSADLKNKSIKLINKIFKK